MKNGISDWLIVAQADINSAASLLKEDYFHTTVVTYLCQQAIEKYFKAFLLENEWELEKTHDLSYLYEEIKKIKNLNLDEEMIREIYDASVETSRYPSTGDWPTDDRAKEYYKFALEVEEVIKKELGA